MVDNNSLKEYSKKVSYGLKEINNKKIFEKGPLSDLLTQISNLSRSKDGFFDINIPRDKPLKIVNPDHEIISNIEISCSIKGYVVNDNYVDYSNYSVEVSLWSNNPKYCYREKLDSKEIEQLVQQNGFQRIFLRFHFDMKSKNATIREPLFHFHIGGAQIESESYMWMPTELSEPRLPYPPMDPLLIIDLLLRNFCLKSSYEVIERPKWKEVLKMCHNMFQKNYDQYSLHSSLFHEN